MDNALTNDLDSLKSKFIKRKTANVIPGETFRLPSYGKQYAPGILSDDVVNGELVLFPLSTLDEIYLKSPDMLFQGTAVEEVFKRRAPQILQPLKLIPKDVDYVLSALRKVTYGDNINITYTCSNTECNQKNKGVAKISHFMAKAKTLEDFDESSLEFELDGFIFKIKFSDYGDLVKLNQKNADNMLDTPEDVYTMFIDNLSLNIESIDDISDKLVIYEFLYNNTDSVFQQELLEKIQDINEWGIEFSVDFACSHCGHINKTPIGINPSSFFSLPSDQET